jgi:hypothetical protein
MKLKIFLAVILGAVFATWDVASRLDFYTLVNPDGAMVLSDRIFEGWLKPFRTVAIPAFLILVSPQILRAVTGFVKSHYSLYKLKKIHELYTKGIYSTDEYNLISERLKANIK